VNDAVVVTNLVKRYRNAETAAVDGVSFSVRRGEVFGLLGPNGAGKTTTIGVLTTRVNPTSGAAMVDGIEVTSNPAGVRQRLAVVAQRSNLDSSLTVRQNLLFHAAYHGYRRSVRNRRAKQVLKRMGITEFAGARVDKMSGGQTQRVMIARALMHQPTVMFLDEPVTGLDPQARLWVHEWVGTLRAEGITVVLTTHDMEEAEKLCDRVGIIDHGRMLTVGRPVELTRALPGSATLGLAVLLGGNHPDKVGYALSTLQGVHRVERINDGAPEGEQRFRLYTTADSAGATHAVLSMLAGLGCVARDLALGRPSLEDVFINLTGRELR
jgi:ABC-2 type transport system ATP-binding protein